MVQRVEELLSEQANDVDLTEAKRASLELRRRIRELDDAVAGAFPAVTALLEWCKGRECSECGELRGEFSRHKDLVQQRLAPYFEALRAVGGPMSYAGQVLQGVLNRDR